MAGFALRIGRFGISLPPLAGAGVLAILAQWPLAIDQNQPVELFSAANHPARVIAEVGTLMVHANENGVRLLETARTAHEYHWNKTR